MTLMMLVSSSQVMWPGRLLWCGTRTNSPVWFVSSLLFPPKGLSVASTIRNSSLRKSLPDDSPEFLPSLPFSSLSSPFPSAYASLHRVSPSEMKLAFRNFPPPPLFSYKFWGLPLSAADARCVFPFSYVSDQWYLYRL